MARAAPRAPSHNAYRGALGRTQTALVHVTTPAGDLLAAQVHTTVDAVADAELVERLHADELNVVRIEGGEPVRVHVPVVYHDAAAELMVLVLGEAHRHRELEERIALYQRMIADGAPVPGYAKEFGVVFGGAGLRSYVERRAQDAVDRTSLEKRTRDVERRATELETARAEIEKTRAEVEKSAGELAKSAGEVAKSRAELDKSRVELETSHAELERIRAEQRARVIAAAQLADRTVSMPAPTAPTDSGDRTVNMLAPTAPVVDRGSPPGGSTAEGRSGLIDREDLATRPIGLRNEASVAQPAPRAQSEGDNFEGIATGVMDMPPQHPAGELKFDEEPTGQSIVPPGSDPLTTETMDLGIGPTDASIPTTPAFAIEGGNVRLLLVADDQIARGFGGNLDVRVLLHRTQHYPLIAIVIGPPPAMRVPSLTQLAVLVLDIANDHDRMVLAQLARKFELTVELFARGKKLRRVRLVAPLAENVAYILRAADDHMRGVMHDGELSPGKAREVLAAPGYDLLGTDHPDTPEFRDDKLAQLESAQHLRRAVAMARRYARPSREDYLVCTRGFPLPRWRELRRHVLESAVAWGLWMGPELAQVAVSEGLARSRRDLIGKLDQGFELLRRNETAFDIDSDAAEDNQKALADEARALGVELKKKNGPILSDELPTISGSIEATPARGKAKTKSVEELLAALDVRDKRVAAALELAERGEPRGAVPVIAAVNKMSRAEAVRVLGMSVKFGLAAKVPLLDGLKSSKGFLRHGSALALAMLRDEDGTQAVIELLLDEPTEIWREIARAIGQVGPAALMPLASNFGKLGEHAPPPISERVAWAMAHIGVRGGKNAIETMAGGLSVMAPVARKALELLSTAARDQVRLSPGGEAPGRDVTVNRAFSRRFFEALEQGIPDAGQAGLSALEASSPMELLDEADLIEDEDEMAELDESDLIQT